MFCPRCGTQANETTKFCRSCGLALTQVTTYVSSGGTAPLQPVPTAPDEVSNPLVRSFLGLEPKQQMILSILFFVFLPGIMAGLSNIIHPLRFLIPLAGITMPLGIIWSVMYFKAQEKKRQLQQFVAPPQAQPITQPQVAPPTTYQAPLTSSQTNPLYEYPPPGSVTEVETQRLPQPPRQRE